MKITFSFAPKNAHAIAKYSKLVGCTQAEMVNHLLAETLSWFYDPASGYTEGFLGSIYYRDRENAERALRQVTQVIRKQYQGNLLASFKIEIRQLPDSRFELKAELVDQYGELLPLC
ncbi:MAG: hypothetical protein WB586_13810 [Chthoniobacterales bacterium]